MWYSMGCDFFQSLFYFIIPIFLFIIIFLLYQNVYGKENKKLNLLMFYTKIAIWSLSFLIIIMLAKVWDDLIDKNYILKNDALNQEINYYVDIYSCNQRFGIYSEYQAEPMNNVLLTSWQIETCRIEQTERQQRYIDLDKNNVLYKWLYRVWFLIILLMVHIIFYCVLRPKKVS
jgi:hypothetical protein